MGLKICMGDETHRYYKYIKFQLTCVFFSGRRPRVPFRAMAEGNCAAQIDPALLDRFLKSIIL